MTHLNTPLCSLLGIEAPIVQAPVCAEPRLAAAVSNAGGLGMLGGSWLELEELRERIRATRQLTSRPFAVNLVLEWDQRARLQVCLEEGVPVLSFFWGDPAGYREPVHDAGALVMHTVGSAQEARRTMEAGTDVVVAQGWEAGGHVWGQVSTLALVPAVVDAVHPTPVVAAGGIADGRGLAAALALGAAGVWMGTRFVASEEASFAPMYKEWVVVAAETNTVYSSLFDIGWPDAPHRTLRNSTIERWEAAGRPPSGSRPGEGEMVAIGPGGVPIRRYEVAEPNAETSGELEALALYAGQSCGLVSGVEPAGQIVRRLVAEAVQTLEACSRLVDHQLP